jgi:hypothetical protein
MAGIIIHKDYTGGTPTSQAVLNTALKNIHLAELYIKLSNGTSSVLVIKFTGGVFVWNGSGYAQIGTVTPSADIYEIWEFQCVKIDNSSFTCTLLKDSVSQGSVTCNIPLPSPITRIVIDAQLTGGNELEHYIQYIKVWAL